MYQGLLLPLKLVVASSMNYRSISLLFLQLYAELIELHVPHKRVLLNNYPKSVTIYHVRS
jgi:hypothetical protein